jgi:hypothetical protein
MPNQFKYLNASKFKSFFQQHQVDIPTFFKSSKSLYRPSNEIFLLKFINYIFRDGKLLKTSQIVNLALWDLFVTMSNNSPFPYYSSSTISRLNFMLEASLYRYAGYLQNKLLSPHTNPRTEHLRSEINLYKIITKLNPVFSFYIYKVDKNIYKNTRGKSGKFTFLWKYIAPYKRNFLVLSWLAKELRIKPGKTFNKRLLALLTSVFFDIKTVWPYKIKKFSHNYVYRNCRKTLAESYITTTN